MPYGTGYGYQPPTAYSANPVSTYSGTPTYTDQSSFSYQPMMSQPVMSNADPRSSGGGESGGGGGMGAGGWMALFQMIGDKLEGRRQAQAAAAAAQADIPQDPAYMVPFLDEMSVEGRQLKDSHLGAAPMAEASAAGHRAATSRGLSGPLAAAVANDSVSRAQGAYDKWRQGALMAHRQMFMDRMGAYMKAVQAYRQAKLRAGYAERESALSKIPVGPIGQALYRLALDNNSAGLGMGYGNTRRGIEDSAQYTPYAPTAY